MRKDFEPPEFSNPLDTNFGETYKGVQANRISRRDFMKAVIAAGGAVLLAGCQDFLPPIIPSPDSTWTPTSSEVVPTATETETLTETPTGTPTETQTPTPTSTETVTPVVGEVIQGVLFPENLRNETQGISFRVSTDAKAIVEEYVGFKINGFDVAPEALTNIREDYLGWVKKLYTQYEGIRWNGYVAFKNVPREEQTISGGGITFNPENIKGSLWDTNKDINFYVVSKGEIESINQGMETQNPGLEKIYALGYDGWILIYTDTNDAGETSVFLSIDRLLSESQKTHDISFPRTDIEKVIGSFVILPLINFNDRVINNAIAMGKRADFTSNFTWLWTDLGCAASTGQNQNCAYVGISR